MKFKKLNDKRQSAKSVLSMFKIQNEDCDEVRGCDENTWMIVEIEVNGEKCIQLFTPKATKIIYDRLVEYAKTNDKISFYSFNRYILDLGDPAYFSSDLMINIIQDDEMEGFGSCINKEALEALMEERLKIDPNNPDLSERDWCMDWEK